MFHGSSMGLNAATGNNEMGALKAAAAVGNSLLGRHHPQLQGLCQGGAERVHWGPTVLWEAGGSVIGKGMYGGHDLRRSKFTTRH